jgi:O-antigen/teichoic acid export membrane protein
VANLLSYRADTFLLAILAGPGPLGRYATGVQLVEPNWIAASALSAAIMASARLRSTDRGTLESLARVDEEGNRELATAVRGAAMVAAGGTGAVAVVLFLTGGAVFGPGFQTLPMIVLGLLPGIASLAVSKVIAGAVIARRRIGIGSLVAAASVSANVVANLVLIPRFAEIGAAFASSISYALSALLWMLAWKRSGGRLRLRDLAPRRADLSVIYSLLPTTALSRRARLPGR